MNRLVISSENLEGFFTDIWLCGPLTLEEFNSAQMALVQTTFTLNPTSHITGWEENGLYFLAEPHQGEVNYWIALHQNKAKGPEFNYLKKLGKLSLI